MKNDFKIGIDLDDTMNNNLEVWLDVYNKRYKDNLSLYDITSWNIDKFCKKCTKTQLFDIIKEKDYYYNLEPKPNAIEVVKKLNEVYEIYIITDWTYGGPNSIIDKCKWLKKYFPFIKDKNIIFSAIKKQFSFNVLIDDNPEHLNMKYNEDMGYRTQGILFNHYHNELVKDKYINFNNWKEIYGGFSISKLETTQN